MSFRTNRRDILYAFSSVVFVVSNTVLLGMIIYVIVGLNRTGNISSKSSLLWFPVIPVMFIWVGIFGFAPLYNLHQLHVGRIYTTDRCPWYTSLFKIRRVDRNGHAFGNLKAVMDWSRRLQHGEMRKWAEAESLNDKDLEYVREVVEEKLLIMHHPDGSTTIAERSAWLLVLMHVSLNAMLLTATVFAVYDVWEGDRTGNISGFSILRGLTEWVSNYVLLILGFQQLLSDRGFYWAFQGICEGSFQTITPVQRDILVALYIASTTKQITGLRQDRCYAPIPMCGTVWRAPRVSTAVLASLGKRFRMLCEDGEWGISWDPQAQAEDFLVKTIGFSNNSA